MQQVSLSLSAHTPTSVLIVRVCTCAPVNPSRQAPFIYLGSEHTQGHRNLTGLWGKNQGYEKTPWRPQPGLSRGWGQTSRSQCASVWFWLCPLLVQCKLVSLCFTLTVSVGESGIRMPNTNIRGFQTLWPPSNKVSSYPVHTRMEMSR